MRLFAIASTFYDSGGVRTYLSLLQHDPLPVIGFLLIAASSVFWFRVLSKVQRTAEKAPGYEFPFSFQLWLSRTYLQKARLGSWSPWPAYLMWLSLASGVAALIAGLLLL
jgi:hypothetical protein